MKKKLVSIVIPIRFDHQGTPQVWLQKRTAETFTGLLEFPGGNSEAGESSLQTAIREFAEEVGVEITHQPIVYFKHYHTKYPDRELFINSFLLNVEGLTLAHEGWSKLTEELKDRSLPGNRVVIDDLIQFSSLGANNSIWKTTSLR